MLDILIQKPIPNYQEAVTKIKTMNIGDKVRLLRSHEEGIITNFLDKDLIEVEIEDGFQIPVMKSEVVVVAKEEGRYFKQEKSIENRESHTFTKQEPKSNQGTYFAFLPVNDRQLALYLINTTDFDLPYVIGEEQNNNFKGISSGILQKQSHIKLREVLVSEFEQWPTWILQLLYFRNGYYTLREPLVRKLRFKASTFFKSKRQAPLLNKPSFLFQVEESGQTEGGKPININQIKERMLSNVEEQDKARLLKLERPPQEVDLHIEKLTNNTDKMNNSEMLELQLRVFEEKLDSAIATGMEEITFVHGVGNGVLKNAIHKKLSHIRDIKYFKDAQREKFGYGATLVRLK